MWKLNVSLLQNDAFCTGVHDFWCNWRLERRRFSLLSNWYEAVKVRLHQFIIYFSCSLAMENKSRFTELNSRLVALERRVHRGESLSTFLEEARAELDKYLSHQAQGAMLGAQVQEATEGGRSMAYFLGQERVRGHQKLINDCLSTPSNVELCQTNRSCVRGPHHQGMFESSFKHAIG